MEGQQYVELPIEPLQHQHFMYCAKCLGMVVKITGGKYLVKYESLSDIYELGKQVARINGPSPYSDITVPVGDINKR